MIETRRHDQEKPGTSSLTRRLLVFAGVLTVITVLIADSPIATRLATRPNTNPLLHVVPADPTVVQEVVGVPQSIIQAVGTGDLPDPLTYIRGQPFLQGPHAHPEFFLTSAQFCQYCATERRAVLNTLGRFGRLTHLGQMQSYEENISTLRFSQSIYISQSLDVAPIEAIGNTLARDGQHFVPLQPLTAEQQQIFTTYDGPPSFEAAGTYPSTWTIAILCRDLASIQTCCRVSGDSFPLLAADRPCALRPGVTHHPGDHRHGQLPDSRTLPTDRTVACVGMPGARYPANRTLNHAASLRHTRALPFL